jgi:1,4-alpha-glucan branching enzyme
VSALDDIVARRHADPHSILGAHQENGHIVVRTYRPEATSVVLRAMGENIDMRRAHDAGVFEGTVPGELPLAYELEVAYPDGNRFTLHDPYAFPPTVSEMDLHLAGEGRHEELYCRLGARVREIEGVAGVTFAVWAPSARAVSVVGDFNSWDGRLHAMRSMGSSGIWELFVPGVNADPPAPRYKFELLTRSGALRMKADPCAFEAEPNPGTSSVIHRSTHRWGDEGWMRSRHALPAQRAPISIYEVHLGS